VSRKRDLRRLFRGLRFRLTLSYAVLFTLLLTGVALAFRGRLILIDSSSGEEFLPVFWDDNYLALVPGEARDITVEYPASAATPALQVEAWNVARTGASVGGR